MRSPLNLAFDSIYRFVVHTESRMRFVRRIAVVSGYAATGLMLVPVIMSSVSYVPIAQLP
jgi:hypothetical protein